MQSLLMLMPLAALKLIPAESYLSFLITKNFTMNFKVDFQICRTHIEPNKRSQ